MAGIIELLGDTLLSKDGDVKTADAFTGKKAVALYFSAHWCPPCRGFTPQFAEWYNKDLKAKGLEVVFVSSDKGDSEFKDYFGEMPWLALPYSDRDRKDSLNRKFKVQGIPTVVILTPEGELISKDGRAAISGDPTGEEMPWKPPTLEELLANAKIVAKDGSTSSGSDLKGKVFAIYFSAHWCPPCRGFTPKLAEWYTNDLKAKGLEIVFVSSDKTEDDFKSYFAEMPWLALDYADRKTKEKLSNLFGVSGIPTVIIVDKDLSVISKDGRASISSDPTGVEFPWYPKPVTNLKDGPGSINEVPTVVAFCESLTAEDQKKVEEAMTVLATKYIDDAKAKREDEPAIAFAMVTESGGIGEKLRSMVGSGKTGDGYAEGTASPTMLTLVDIPDNGGYYAGPEGNITTEVVQKFVVDYLGKNLERKQLG